MKKEMSISLNEAKNLKVKRILSLSRIYYWNRGALWKEVGDSIKCLF